MPPVPDGFSPLESWLLGILGTGVAGLIALLTWVVKSFLPKVLETAEQRTQVLIDAFKQIPEAIDRFEKGLAGVEARLTAKIDERKYADLREEIERMQGDEPTPSRGLRGR
ncbi:hypothetical protein BE21_57460 [Sorangium cellulosum]|uniref:Uncharacterized protein n=1 Tax=Sorangium cellulosum TaxID=56 RepID=A0A150U3A1_SORCE|nr:hypothetical protein BE21_57460 [Sorangium cellulosum]